MHSGKLNWTQLNSTELDRSVQFSSVFRCELNQRPAATTDRRRPSPVVAARRPFSCNDRHCVDWPRVCPDSEEPATSANFVAESSQIVAGRRRFNAQRETELNWTELNDPVQLSSVQFSFYRASAYWYWYSKSVCPSVRPSVCPLRSGIRWKRLNISSQFFQHTVAQSF